jgi:nucleotide-binding universal stress UspA family protein
VIKRILVPTDGSEYSKHALSTAIEFAKKFRAEIELLNVVTQPRSYGTFTAGISADFSEEQIAEIGKDVFDITLLGINTNKITINKKIATGHPAAEILEEIKSDIDMVIMGSHGYGPFIGAIIGSVTLHVLAHAHCPVVVVK